MKVNIDYFNEFCIMNYHGFNRLRKAVLTITLINPTTSSFKPYPPVDNFNISIKSNPTTTGFDMMNQVCDETKKISLVNPEENSVPHAQFIMTNRGQGRNMTLDIYIFFPKYEPNTIGSPINALFPD